MNNCPFKYFGNLRETHTLNEYLVTSVRASSLLSNFIDVTTALMKENISYNLYKEEFRTIEYFCEPLYCSLRVGVSFPPSSFSFFSLSLLLSTVLSNAITLQVPPSSVPRYRIFPNICITTERKSVQLVCDANQREKRFILSPIVKVYRIIRCYGNVNALSARVNLYQ